MAALSCMSIALPAGGHLSVLYNCPAQLSSTAPSLLFLPFWGGSARTFTSILQSLKSQSPSTISIAVSYPGTGTAQPRSNDVDAQSHTIPGLTNDLLAALQSPQIQDLIPSKKLLVVAHSMSAKIVYELMAALNSPPNPAQQLTITSVLLLAPAPPTPLVLPPEMRQQQLTAYATSESARWTMANVLSNKPLASDVLDDLAADAANMSEGAKRGWIELGMAHDCSPSLQKLNGSEVMKVPVKVLVGSEDQVETAERVRKETVEPSAVAGWDVSMEVIQGAGHLLPLEAVDEVVDAVRDLLEYS